MLRSTLESPAGNRAPAHLLVSHIQEHNMVSAIRTQSLHNAMRLIEDYICLLALPAPSPSESGRSRLTVHSNLCTIFLVKFTEYLAPCVLFTPIHLLDLSDEAIPPLSEYFRLHLFHPSRSISTTHSRRPIQNANDLGLFLMVLAAGKGCQNVWYTLLVRGTLQR